MNETSGEYSGSLRSLSREDITRVLDAVEAVIGEERGARASGVLVDFDQPFSPAVWAGREPPQRDRILIDVLSTLSQDARDELQALFYFGRDRTPIADNLKSIKSMGGGEPQVNYLYGELLRGEEWIRKAALKLEFSSQF